MRITVIGTGYVGLVTGACFAHVGNKVACVDIDAEKIERLTRGEIPIYEPGLEPIVKENLAGGSLAFTTDLGSALAQCQIAMIAVGTPMGEDGSADTSYVLAAARDIGKLMAGPLVVVTKSTVPVGTGEAIRKVVAEALAERGAAYPFSVASNPEFLKEGAAVDDFLRPDRIVVGANDDATIDLMKELYRPFLINHDRMQVMDLVSAEMTKYAANAMLATKISFMNEMAAICERVGADVTKVRIGIGSDSRIGYSFLYAGAGYGGSCFPKDVRALISTARSVGCEPRILEAVETVNAAQKTVVAEKVAARFGENLEGRTFALWGLAFKPETDDMREAPSLEIIRELVRRGARIRAYDPKSMGEARRHYLADVDAVEFAETKYEALKGADALILATEWKEFRSPDFDEIGTLLRSRIIFDGRNQFDRGRLRQMGFEYYEIGYRAPERAARNGEVVPAGTGAEEARISA